MQSFFQSLRRTKTTAQALSLRDDENPHGGLQRVLGVRDLTAFGIAAIIGAGIFGMPSEAARLAQFPASARLCKRTAADTRETATRPGATALHPAA
jgi:hypothetical protein